MTKFLATEFFVSAIHDLTISQVDQHDLMTCRVPVLPGDLLVVPLDFGRGHVFLVSKLLGPSLGNASFLAWRVRLIFRGDIGQVEQSQTIARYVSRRGYEEQLIELANPLHNLLWAEYAIEQQKLMRAG